MIDVSQEANKIGLALGQHLGDKDIGFALMLFTLGEPETDCEFVSNCDRRGMIILLKMLLARLECQSETVGHA